MLQAVLLQFAIEGGSSYPEHRGCDSAVAFRVFEGMQNRLLLHFSQRDDARSDAVGTGRERQGRGGHFLVAAFELALKGTIDDGGRKIGGRNPRARVHGDHLLNRVLEFADVTGPIVVYERIHNLVWHLVVISITL